MSDEGREALDRLIDRVTFDNTLDDFGVAMTDVNRVQEWSAALTADRDALKAEVERLRSTIKILGASELGAAVREWAAEMPTSGGLKRPRYEAERRLLALAKGN